jgi:CheY-like chemotaxis protein
MASKSSKDKEPRPLKEASVLVVEDHTFVLDLLERMLKSRVGGLHAARSGEDAFYNLEQNPALAHVAIVDYHLLGMNGLKFIEKLRTAKSETLRNLPVIMLTGDNDMNLYRAAARLGISGFLVKPVAAANLVEALERALAGGKVAKPRLDVDPIVKPTSAKAAALAETLPEHLDPDADKQEERPAPPHQPLDFKA